MSLFNKNAFQYDACRPLQWSSGGGGGVLPEGCLPRGCLHGRCLPGVVCLVDVCLEGVVCLGVST